MQSYFIAVLITEINDTFVSFRLVCNMTFYKVISILSVIRYQMSVDYVQYNTNYVMASKLYYN